MIISPKYLRNFWFSGALLLLLASFNPMLVDFSGFNQQKLNMPGHKSECVKTGNYLIFSTYACKYEKQDAFYTLKYVGFFQNFFLYDSSVLEETSLRKRAAR